MSLTLPDNCPRNRKDCEPISQILDDEDGFICMGCNDGTTRLQKQDIFRLCWKGPHVDETDDMDERDIIDTISVLAQGLSVHANRKANDES